jgi:hypothetical protein
MNTAAPAMHGALYLTCFCDKLKKRFPVLRESAYGEVHPRGGWHQSGFLFGVPGGRGYLEDVRPVFVTTTAVR